MPVACEIVMAISTKQQGKMYRLPVLGCCANNQGQAFDVWLDTLVVRDVSFDKELKRDRHFHGGSPVPALLTHAVEWYSAVVKSLCYLLDDVEIWILIARLPLKFGGSRYVQQRVAPWTSDRRTSLR
jgi:hypothetical protein